MINHKRTHQLRIAVLAAIATLVFTLGWLPATNPAGAAPAGPSAPAAPSTLPASMPFTDSAFETVWMRNDQPVATHATARSWTWGPAPLASGLEAYAEAADGSGTRLVQYFD